MIWHQALLSSRLGIGPFSLDDDWGNRFGPLPREIPNQAVSTVCLGWFCRDGHKASLTDRPGKSEVGLLVRGEVKLQSRHSSVLHYLVHRMDVRFDFVLGAPETSSHVAGFVANLDDIDGVSSRALDGLDIEAHLPSSLAGAEYMH